MSSPSTRNASSPPAKLNDALQPIVYSEAEKIRQPWKRWVDPNLVDVDIDLSEDKVPFIARREGSAITNIG